ncbi:MAG: hypothetical protein HY537_08510 [Deltaproteobacteria bacterium]|nr:hypothetical protein [Deltaproteobacteria bacterium]
MIIKMQKPVAVALALLFSACTQSPVLKNPSENEWGAKVYYDWLMKCLEEVHQDMPRIVKSAEAAAKLVIQNNVQVGYVGDPQAISEGYGRAGGLYATWIGAFGLNMPEANKIQTEIKPGVYLYFVLDDRVKSSENPTEIGVGKFEDDAQWIRNAVQAGPDRHVIAIGRSNLLERLRKMGIKPAASLDNHAAPTGGLFQDSQKRWVVPTDSVANVLLLWVWTGEFAAACSRLGKMPFFWHPGAPSEWREKIGERLDKQYRRYYRELPARIEPRTFGDSFIQILRSQLQALYQEELLRIKKLAGWATNAKANGKKFYGFLHGHGTMRALTGPHVPDRTQTIDYCHKGWFDFRDKTVELKPGSVVLFLGHGGMPNWGGFEKHNYPEQWRRKKVKIAWSFGYNDSLEEMKKKIETMGKMSEDEMMIDQHVPQGDAVVSVPGLEHKILPISYVMGASILWMVVAELLA